MASTNPFPESPQKAFLRRYHLNQFLAPYRKRVGRDLTYFGLPSAEMHDVVLWRRSLGQITAVENMPEIALSMLRTAQRIGVRDKMILLEMDLTEATRLLAQDEREIELSLALMSSPVARNVRRARSIGYDIINIDLCGGFLYPRKARNEGRRESAYEKAIRQLIAFQARRRCPFILVVTFNTRDAGKSEYDLFIDETLKFLFASGIDTTEVRRFYTARTVPGQSPNLRRLRFCVPTYLHKISYEHYEVQGLGAWYYKRFYHSVLFLEPRHDTGVLGPWPPPDEVKDLLGIPLQHVILQDGEITLADLPAPSFS